MCDFLIRFAIVMNRIELQKRLDSIGVPRNYYCLKDFDFPYCFLEGYVLSNTSNQWESYLINERGSKKDIQLFENEADACEYFFSKVSAYWDEGKHLWSRDQDIDDLISAYHNIINVIFRWTGRLMVKGKLYPVTNSFDRFLAYVTRKEPQAAVSQSTEGSTYISITLGVQTIVIHEQNGKLYVVNNFNKFISGLAILDSVPEACIVAYYFLIL